jgi:hypothetical protein
MDVDGVQLSEVILTNVGNFIFIFSLAIRGGDGSRITSG